MKYVVNNVVHQVTFHYTRKLTQQISHIDVLNVANSLVPLINLFDTQQFTQEKKSHLRVPSVRKSIRDLNTLLNTCGHTQERSHMNVYSVAKGIFTLVTLTYT